MRCDVTVIALVRTGYATTAACLETLYANTATPVQVIFADIASPEPVRRYLAGLAAARDGFVHLRFDDYVTRQQARIAALERVDTRDVVLLDNNMLCAAGWLEALLAARAETGAAVVSPIIVTHGGRVHFSAGLVQRKRRRLIGRRRLLRPHTQPGAPIRAMLADTRPRRVAIDFAESHCCLVAADDLRLPGVLEPAMHNAHTTCYASYALKHRYGRTLILDPAAVVAILPIAFGYDLPWICNSYMRADLLDDSYRLLQELLGVGPGTDKASGFEWHAKHLKYLLLSMHEGDRLERDDLLSLAEVPAYLDGYDFPLPVDADAIIARDVLPRIARRYPDLLAPLEAWLRPRA